MKKASKKAFFALFACMFATMSYAQKGTFGNDVTSRWKSINKSHYVGLRLGVNASQLFYTNLPEDCSTSSMAGLSVGLTLGIRMSKEIPLYFEPGLLYNGKGARATGVTATSITTDGPVYSDPDKITTRMHYFEVPLVFKYKMNLGPEGFSVQPFLGGFMGLGFGGNTKYYATREKVGTFRKRGFSVGDLGLRLGCGAEYQKFYFDLSYDIGLADVVHDRYTDMRHDAFNDRVRTGCLTFSVGVNL